MAGAVIPLNAVAYLTGVNGKKKNMPQRALRLRDEQHCERLKALLGVVVNFEQLQFKPSFLTANYVARSSRYSDFSIILIHSSGTDTIPR